MKRNNLAVLLAIVSSVGIAVFFIGVWLLGIWTLGRLILHIIGG